MKYKYPNNMKINDAELERIEKPMNNFFRSFARGFLVGAIVVILLMGGIFIGRLF